MVTVEDPVEYRMDGVNQVPVNPKRGLTFAGALRSILRQDPDVVLVGEIRDTETADIAVKAALTGHLVLSTLHTNDAASTDHASGRHGHRPVHGVELAPLHRRPAPGAQAVPALPTRGRGAARRSCSPSASWRRTSHGCELFGAEPRRAARAATTATRAASRSSRPCSSTEKLKRMVVEGRSVHELKRGACAQGMLTLRRVGLLNAMRGVTSLEEVLRVTLEDD